MNSRSRPRPATSPTGPPPWCRNDALASGDRPPQRLRPRSRRCEGGPRSRARSVDAGGASGHRPGDLGEARWRWVGGHEGSACDAGQRLGPLPCRAGVAAGHKPRPPTGTGAKPVASGPVAAYRACSSPPAAARPPRWTVWCRGTSRCRAGVPTWPAQRRRTVEALLASALFQRVISWSRSGSSAVRSIPHGTRRHGHHLAPSCTRPHARVAVIATERRCTRRARRSRRDLCTV